MSDAGGEAVTVVPSAPCSQCGGSVFTDWKVTAAGGTSPPLVPLAALQNPTCRLRCCLACGLLQWFVTPDTLVELRAKFEPSAADR